MKIFAKHKVILLTVIITLISCITTYSKGLVDDDYRNNVLYIAEIIDNLDNLEMPVSRNDFAKMVVKTSPFKDSGYDYVRLATENKYMIRTVYGEFNGGEFTTYNDLIRASLALLSYTDKDFTGNKVNARMLKFLELQLNDNIEKSINDQISKQDILNALYNTLKEKLKDSDKKLYEIVFTDMTIDFNGELNASGLQKSKLEGPFFIKRNDKTSIPYDTSTSAFYINGKMFTEIDLDDDIYNYGYAVVYYDKFNNTVYSYTGRDDVSCTVACKIDYVGEVNYQTSDMVTPSSVDIGNYRYELASDEMKFAFSFAGYIKPNDKIIMVYNKMNDIVNNDSDDPEQKDSGRMIKGSIITAFKVE